MSPTIDHASVDPAGNGIEINTRLWDGTIVVGEGVRANELHALLEEGVTFGDLDRHTVTVEK